jgi:hypothetical protein
MNLRLAEPHRLRRIRFHELLSAEGWRIKVYSIVYGGREPRPELMAAAIDVAADHLHRAPMRDRGCGAGFLGVHEGRGANFVFLDRWGNENELFHSVWLSSPDEPIALRPAAPSDASVCVWDLHLQYFERNAWVECVLANPRGPDVEAYLARRCNEEA